MDHHTSENQNATDKKIVLITGTSSGIGESTAIAFAKAGYQTIATLRNPDKSKSLLEKAENENVDLDIRVLDVCDDQSVSGCVNRCIETYGRIDVLINNAGVGYRGTLERIPMEDIIRTMDVNYYSVARVTKAVLPHMRKSRSGHIITVTSLGGLIGVPFNDAYCAAKFAVEGLMESLAPVVSAFGVRVSLIEPGPVHTNFVHNVGTNLSSDETSNPYSDLERAAIQAMVKRFATTGQTPDEIANIIVDAAMSGSPHFRYPTSSFATQHAARKYTDTTGDSVIHATGATVLNPS